MAIASAQTPLVRVGIFVPSKGQAQPRHVYWSELLQQLERWEVNSEEVALSDLTGANFQIRNWEQYDVIVVTTDTANGADEFGGKTAQTYFENSQIRETLVRWVKKGGILLSEVQSRGGRPQQASYDAIFGPAALTVLPIDQVERQEADCGAGYENVLRREQGRSSRGSTALVSAQFHAHPLSNGVHPFVRNGYSYSGEQIICGDYRGDKKSWFSLYYRCPEIVYSGWFVDWKREWIPVLVESETAKWPVLLVRTDEKGAWVASTMRLSSPEALPLVRNIVTYRFFGESWQRYHRLKFQDRTVKDVVWILGATIIFSLVGWRIGFDRVWAAFKWVNPILGISACFAVLWCVNSAIAFLRRPMGHPRLRRILWRVFWK